MLHHVVDLRCEVLYDKQKVALHTKMFGPGAELRGLAKAWKKSGGLAKTSSSSSSRSARDFNRSGGRRGELLLSC